MSYTLFEAWPLRTAAIFEMISARRESKDLLQATDFLVCRHCGVASLHMHEGMTNAEPIISMDTHTCIYRERDGLCRGVLMGAQTAPVVLRY